MAAILNKCFSSVIQRRCNKSVVDYQQKNLYPVYADDDATNTSVLAFHNGSMQFVLNLQSSISLQHGVLEKGFK